MTPPVFEVPLESFYDQSHPWKTYFQLFRRDWSQLAWALVFYLIKHTPVWVLPVYIGFAVDQIVSGLEKSGGFSWQPLVLPSLVMFVLIVQNVATHTIFARLLSLAIRNMEASIRTAQVQRLQQLSLHFHSRRSPGALQNKMLRDVENLTNLTNNLVNSVFPSVVTILLAMILTLAKAPLLTVLFLTLAPLSLFLQRIFVKRLNQNNTEFRKNLETMNSRVLEMIEMTPVTRAHGLEEVEVKKMGRHFAQVQVRGLRLDLTIAWFGSSAWAAFMTAQLVSLLAMIGLASAKVITPGDILLFQSYFTSLIGSLNAMLNLLPDLARGKDSISSMAEILECPDLEWNRGKVIVPLVRGDFRAEDLSFQYEGAKGNALQHLTFHVKAGETIAIVGESGSGKSTLMQVLLGFCRPTSGRLLLDDTDMSSLDLRSFRRFVSTVPQQTVLFQGTVRENLVYGLSGVTDQKIGEVLERTWSSLFVSQLPQGLDTDLGIHGGTLSGGQRQRLAIARALLRDPRVLLFDEATSSLDLQSEREVQKAIQEASRDRTTFIVAHRLNTIRKADRVFVLKDGKLAESGSGDELLTRGGEFSRLSRLDFQDQG